MRDRNFRSKRSALFGKRPGREADAGKNGDTWIYGVRSVEELLRRRPHQVAEIIFSRQDEVQRRIRQQAEKGGILCRLVPPQEIEIRTQNPSHHGIAAKAPLPEYLDWKGLKHQLGQNPRSLLLVLDCIQDPQNLGALLRVADGAGAGGVVIPQDRAAGFSPAVLSASAGAGEWVPVARVKNLHRALLELKQEGFWVIAADPEGEHDFQAVEYPAKTAVVIGSESKGLRPLVRQTCDLRVRIPLRGKVMSLNAGVAGALVLFEVASQVFGPVRPG